MKIAIAGAGLAGLATAFFFSEFAQVFLFDPKGVGGGASGVAAGLLNPYAGQSGRRVRFGEEGVEESIALISLASKEAIISQGLLKIPFGRMEEGLRKAPPDEVSPHPKGFWIEKGFVIDTPLYLQQLFSLFLSRGGHFERRKLVAGEDFDHFIYCTGSEAPFIRRIKGHLLEFDLETSLPPLAGKGYMIPKGGKCLVGSSFEKEFFSEEPILEVAIREIIPKMREILPELETAPLIRCLAGIRASTPDHLPLIARLSSNEWLYTGLGSKGLLYHAFFAKRLVTEFSAFQKK